MRLELQMANSWVMLEGLYLLVWFIQECELGHVRNKLILQSTHEENRHLCNLGQNLLTEPVLVAETSQISGRGEHPASFSYTVEEKKKA